MQHFIPWIDTETPLTVPELPKEEAYPCGPLLDQVVFDTFLLEKSRRRLTAFWCGHAVRVYLVALGRNPVGQKQQEGDGRTPEGVYTINAKNPASAYHLNLGISYPDAADVARAQLLGLSPGGDIKIHGLPPGMAALGPAHRIEDWTLGCIAVTNQEIEEIYRRTKVGATIEIVA